MVSTVLINTSSHLLFSKQTQYDRSQLVDEVVQPQIECVSFIEDNYSRPLSHRFFSPRHQSEYNWNCSGKSLTNRKRVL